MKFKSYITPDNEVSRKVNSHLGWNEKWGHLDQKFLFILQRIDYLNDLSNSIFEQVSENRKKLLNREYIKGKDEVKPYIEIIHLVNDVRMLVDELISLLFISEYKTKNGSFPDKIKISSIGEFLEKCSNENNTYLLFFKDYKEYIESINDLSNSYKHSFINSEILFHRQKEYPIILAAKNPFNKFKGERVLIAENLEIFIENFNDLFENYLIELKKHYS